MVSTCCPLLFQANGLLMQIVSNLTIYFFSDSLNLQHTYVVFSFWSIPLKEQERYPSIRCSFLQGGMWSTWQYAVHTESTSFSEYDIFKSQGWFFHKLLLSNFQPWSKYNVCLQKKTWISCTHLQLFSFKNGCNFSV